MSDSWETVPHPGHSKSVREISEDGEVTLSRPDRALGSPAHAENYNSTDGRHSRPDHQGWLSVDRNSGEDAGEDGEAHGRFPDGPGAWRQT